MSDKIRLGVLFGGRSCEHEVSVTSARSVLEAIDRQRYEVTMIGISKEGHWLLAGDAAGLLARGQVEGDDLVPAALDYAGDGQLRVRGPSGTEAPDRRPLDVVFPILHGPHGEDGTVQGLLELAGVAYVGAGVVGSAVGMDKELMKRVFRAEGLPQVDYAVVRRSRWQREPAAVRAEIESRMAYPLFVKPANLGSSVGITKAHDAAELVRGMDQAAAFDRKLVVEAAALDCREVECAVLGNEAPRPSVLGEIVPGNEFYDYNAKYLDDNSQLIVPARVSPATAARIQELAVRAFQAVDAAGLARVDFFVGKQNERVYVNEINTMPGFTPISMYPKLWQASGIGYSELIDRLVQLALERHADQRQTRAAL